MVEGGYGEVQVKELVRQKDSGNRELQEAEKSGRKWIGKKNIQLSS